MSEPLTPEEVAEIREALAKATPGPWEMMEDRCMWGPSRDPDCDDCQGSGFLENPVQACVTCRRQVIETESGYMPPKEQDAHLIAHAPTWLARLLDDNARLRAKENAKEEKSK